MKLLSNIEESFVHSLAAKGCNLARKLFRCKRDVTESLGNLCNYSPEACPSVDKSIAYIQYHVELSRGKCGK
jgi:hypothetical protein